MSRSPHTARWVGGAAAAVLMSVLLPAGVSTAEPDGPRLFLPFSYPPDGSSMMGEENAGPRAAVPGITAPLVPPVEGRGKASPPRSHAQVLDDLFQRLSAAQDEDEAKAVAGQIETLWLQSGSDTADLLLSRAAEALGKGDQKLALELLDKVVILQPAWGEAWNKRAIVRFMDDDGRGAMEDIAQVLHLEPRHFGALSGMAILLQQQGMKAEALAVLRRSKAIYPSNGSVQKMIDTLVPEVEGQPL